jgi:hypothetical protein
MIEVGLEKRVSGSVKVGKLTINVYIRRMTVSSSTRSPVDVLLGALDRSFSGPGWHGPTLLGSLRGVGHEAAAWRPGPKRHNVWEIAVHAAYWKYRVYRLLTEEPPRSFGVRGSNWFARPLNATAEAWLADLQLLDAWHERLRVAVGSFDGSRLGERPGRSQYTHEELITGAAAHDVYHAGQIQLLKKLRT